MTHPMKELGGLEAVFDAWATSLPDDQVQIGLRTGKGLAGATDWHVLIENLAWQDLSQCLKDSIEEARDELEECHLSRIPQVRGMIKAYKAILAIPEDSVRELEQQSQLERDQTDE